MQSKLKAIEDSHLALLTDGKAEEIGKEFDGKLNPGSEYETKVDLLLAEPTLTDDQRSSARGFALLQILTGKSGFTRRNMKQVKQMPSALLGLAKSHWQQDCPLRRTIAKRLVDL